MPQEKLSKQALSAKQMQKDHVDDLKLDRSMITLRIFDRIFWDSIQSK